MKSTYALDFLDHVRKHHAYLLQSKNPNRATFAQVIGSADRLDKVAELVKTKEFRKIIAETTAKEADNIVNALEKHLSSSNTVILCSLKEIEDIVYYMQGHDQFGTKYLMLTDRYLADSKEKNRIQRLMQISKNKKVETRIVKSETPAGKRISQFGGIVLFTLRTK
jgi:stalled ribosome rescue protein Dom34